MEITEQWQEQDLKLANPHLAALLKWAVMLHEVGQNINHSGMHRHSAYILQITIATCRASIQEQQMLMATLVRYRRKAIKLDDLACRALYAIQEKAVSAAEVSYCPRLGVLLNSQRQATTTPPTRCACRRKLTTGR
ncbi:hypothetical protein MJ565_20140 [Klebsiella pneumoniae]|nr:hypothetical protein MJ565_20140 [Klebsiella pneumoniae]